MYDLRKTMKQLVTNIRLDFMSCFQLKYPRNFLEYPVFLNVNHSNHPK